MQCLNNLNPCASSYIVSVVFQGCAECDLLKFSLKYLSLNSDYLKDSMLE